MRTENIGLWPSNPGVVFLNHIAGRDRSHEIHLLGVA